jgi:hypothetical protein
MYAISCKLYPPLRVKYRRHFTAGRPTTLTAEQKEILKDYVLSNKSRIVCRELVELVQEKWGIKCNNHLCKSFPELEETVSRILFELQNHKFIAGQ